MNSKLWETVIGLEVHVELKTKSKIFCGCSTEFGAEPNTHVCPVCLGLPGVLPVLNHQVLDYAVRAGLALNCKIAEFSKFDRKNYYYPDLPKNFQTSQYDLPICYQGSLQIDTGEGPRSIGITRIHMEEDAGKLIHTVIGEENEKISCSLVDYNRTGVPLIEIVSEPDMRSPEEARAYVEKLRDIIAYLDISDVKMEEGSLRCDANISVRPRGEQKLGTKTELKNINSFRSLQRALTYEEQRHIDVLSKGGTIIQETRSWDDAQGISAVMRTKEEANDYRYFPEPDLVPLIIDKEWVERLKSELPELPDVRCRRFTEQYDLPLYDAGILTSSRAMADYFEQCASFFANPKMISNWLMGDLSRLLNAAGQKIDECQVAPQQLAALLQQVSDDKISGSSAKIVLEEMFAGGEDPEKIIAEKGLEQISSTSALEKLIDQVLEANPQSVADYHAGKKKAVGFLVGQVMKASQGKANPVLVNKLLQDKMTGR